jgi:hypothetical protein
MTGATHTGSTLIGLLLNAHPQISCVGELHALQGNYVGGKPCTCGLPLVECDFWRGVQDEARRASGNRIKSLADLRTQPEPGERTRLQKIGRLLQAPLLAAGSGAIYQLSRLLDPVQHEAAANSVMLSDAVRRSAGTPIVVDTTKWARHWRAMAALDEKRFRLLYVIRDGRALSASAKRRRGAAPADYACEWVATHRAIAAYISQLDSRRILRVRYESVCRDPATELTRICGWLGVEFSPAMLQVDRDNAHNCGGNKMRKRRDEREIRLDERWRNELSADEVAAFNRAAGWLNQRLGYRD